LIYYFKLLGDQYKLNTNPKSDYVKKGVIC